MIFKYIELILLYILTPIIAFILLYEYRLPLLLIFLPLIFLFIIILSLDKTFSWQHLLKTKLGWKDTLRIFILFLLSSLCLTLFAYSFEREAFLSFVRSRPYLWALVMLLYPLISVTTQELMYRVFFFHRYENLFKNTPWLFITINALLFGYAHIIFQNWYAVILSAIGGLMFAYTYQKSRSFLAICLEHSLYGCLIFTLGLGRYFFTGISNFN